MSLASLKERKYSARGVVQNVGTDTPVAIRIKHTGSTAVTSVTVTAATNIVLIDGAATTTSTFATDTTVAKVIATINASGTWEARALDTLLTMATTSSQFLNGAITSGYDEKMNVVWDVLADTDNTKEFTTCLSTHRNFNTPDGHRMHLQEIVYNVTLGGAGANLLNVYDRYKGVETKIFTDTSVSATKTSYTFSLGFGDITALEDHDIVVRLSDGTSITDAAANYLRVTGVFE